MSLTPENAAAAIVELQSCLEAVQNWMNSNKMKLNSDKTEFIVFGTDALRAKLSHIFPINILGNPLTPVENVRSLGVIFDASFTFSKHVSSICKSCFYHIRDFARIRRYLGRSTSIAVANALVGSRIDYCNSILDGVSVRDLKRLRSVQYALCRIINRTSRYSKEHMSPHLKALHWLPVEHRISFKWFLLIFKTLKTGLPQYFQPYFRKNTSGVSTRRSSADSMFLSHDVIPFSNKIHRSKVQFDRCFLASGPERWNQLPSTIRCAPPLGTFRSRLKSFLFNKAFPP